ncbi:hypothetical protein [Microbacterium suwonense]|uniref:Alpha/beta hydrolase n=1 Tax=Microbacterium suwonense TaxID=683047 RepID=A0ABM8FWF5_9MICO|nr:hypothetical protein [Microbacterium suwonense]BDZ40067.1 hypothetical protein GCM10025863_26810 [Microbacterium suwonense]
MSGELNITSGGAVKVDSEAFRAVGRRLGAVAGRMREAADATRRAAHVLSHLSPSVGHIDVGSIRSCADRLERRSAEADSDATGTQLMADVFEVVELRAEREALGIARPDEALALQDRIDALLASDPRIGDMATVLVAGWEKRRFEGVTDQSWDGWLAAGGIVGGTLSPAFSLLLTRWLTSHPVGSTMGFLRDLTLKFDRGVLPADVRLHGDPPAVEVSMVESRTVAPVAGLKESMERVPYGSKGQVAVEKYTMKDGSKRFVAYIDGTREMKPGTSEPWDSVADWEMYVDRRTAASHEATLKAIADAGAKPGDAVDLVGYSQGAMIASHIAMDSPYDVGTLIVAGDPVDPALTRDQTLVRLENGADPVNGLATGGTAGGTGSPDSFTVARTVDRNSPIDPHLHGQYVGTAAQTDASRDPRVRTLHEKFFAELGEAASVERMEFSATRP